MLENGGDLYTVDVKVIENACTRSDEANYVLLASDTAHKQRLLDAFKSIVLLDILPVGIRHRHKLLLQYSIFIFCFCLFFSFSFLF